MKLNKKTIWAIVAVAVVVLIIVLVVVLPGGDGEPGPTPTPTPTPVTTEGPTATPRPTDTSRPQPTATGESGDVFFGQDSYAVSNGEEFTTRVIMGLPVELFYGAQFDLEWDHTVLELKKQQTIDQGKGQLSDGTTWYTPVLSMGLKGSGPDDQGRATILVDWDNYAAIYGKGLDASDGWLCDLHWEAVGTGATELEFVPVTQLAALTATEGAKEIPSNWIDSTVTVQ